MALTITEAIARIKSDVAHLLTPDSIRTICRRVGHSWRQRLLDPVTTVHLFMLQVLHRNTASGNNKGDIIKGTGTFSIEIVVSNYIKA